MKITFLGISGALSSKWNSNILIEEGKDCLLFDCGEDIMHSLRSSGRTPEELTAVYISHLHYDHMGGLSWLGYYSYFVMKKKLRLYIHESMISDLWAMLSPAMNRLEGIGIVSLSEYFNIVVFRDNDACVVGSFFFEPCRQLHIETPHGNMYSYGASFWHSTLERCCWKAKSRDAKSIFISSDTKQLVIPPTDSSFGGEKYEHDLIFSDCDVMNLGGVHPNYDNLKKIDNSIKKNMWLYHYTDLDSIGQGPMPDCEADGFAGFVKEGQVFRI